MLACCLRHQDGVSLRCQVRLRRVALDEDVASGAVRPVVAGVLACGQRGYRPRWQPVPGLQDSDDPGGVSRAGVSLPWFHEGVLPP